MTLLGNLCLGWKCLCSLEGCRGCSSEISGLLPCICCPCFFITAFCFSITYMLVASHRASVFSIACSSVDRTFSVITITRVSVHITEQVSEAWTRVTNLAITLVLVSSICSMVVVVVVLPLIRSCDPMLLDVLLVGPVCTGSICITIEMGVVRSPTKLYWCSMPESWFSVSLSHFSPTWCSSFDSMPVPSGRALLLIYQWSFVSTCFILVRTSLCLTYYFL